jgi:hypothetical protein
MWWNPQSFVGDEAGGFRELETMPDGGITRIRAADGIHLSDEGAALLAPALIQWLNPAPPANTAQVTPLETPSGSPNRQRRERHVRTARP